MEENNLLKERIENAPEQIREYLTSGSWKPIVKEVCQKNNFSEDQLSSLENEVLFVLIGFDIQNNLAKNIEQELRIAPVLASDISKELRERIFSGLREFLPTQVEEEPFSILLNQAEKLIEDAPGNKDNVLPSSVKPLTPNPGTSFQKTISSQTPATVAPSAENVIVKKPYPDQDPYREPPKP